MADETYRIEIPIEAIDKTQPALNQAQKKISEFEKSAKRTEQQLKKLNSVRWKLTLYAVDKASTVIKAVRNQVSNLVSRGYNITLRVTDFITRPLRAIGRLLTSTMGLLGMGAGVAGLVGWPTMLAANLEQAQISLEVMLGSAEAAKKRLQELSLFAAQTPYEFPEVVEASRILQVFGGNALATGENLRLVGDIAAGTTRPFTEVAMWIGRMYDALASGRPFGEAAMRLQEMGALSGQARERIEKLAKSSKDINKIWPQVVKEFSTFNGMMQRQSRSLTGLISTIMDVFKISFLARWGEGIRKSLVPRLQQVADWFDRNTEVVDKWGAVLEEAGHTIAESVMRRIEDLKDRLASLVNSRAWQEAGTLGDRLKLVWDKVIVEPFDRWWNSGGKEAIIQKAEMIGRELGGAIGGFLLAALGLAQDTSKLGESPFVQAGVTAGSAFLEGFMQAFDANKITGKLVGAFWETQKHVGQFAPFGASPDILSWLGLGLDIFLISKAIQAGRNIMKGYRWGKETIQGWKNIKAGADAAKTATEAAQVTTKATNWAALARRAGRVAVPLAVAADVYSIAKAQPGVERAKAIVGSLGSWAGVIAGAKAGAALGTAVAPGMGTAIGSFIGGLTGAILGRKAGTKAGEFLANPVNPKPIEAKAKIEVTVKHDPVYQINSTASAEEVLDVIRRNNKQIADELQDEIARTLEGIYVNMPAFYMVR